MKSPIKIYCRRCRVEISSVEPGALIGCVSCRLYTLATLTHSAPPATDRATDSSSASANKQLGGMQTTRAA
jgi:hypothetical protein